jgi:glycosyltransferase involved in cell wall biosynthesis
VSLAGSSGARPFGRPSGEKARAGLNVLHLTPYYAPAWTFGGVPRAVTDLARAQLAAGHRVTVLTTDVLDATARIPARAEVRDGVRIVRARTLAPRLRGWANLSIPLGLTTLARRLMKENGVEVVHCHELRTVENLVVVPEASRSGAHVLLSPHGTLSYRTGRGRTKRVWDALFGRRLASRIGTVVALTDVEAAEARALWTRLGMPLPDASVAVVPNGVNADEFARLPPRVTFRQARALGDGPIILFLGRLAERKGLTILLDAFAAIARELLDATLVLAGPDFGMRGRLLAQVAARGLNRRVIFPGLLTGEDRLALLAAADVFVLPGVGEGFSVAVLEAMACGLPVVLGPGYRFPEAFAAGAAIAAPAEDAGLATILVQLLRDPGRADVGRCGRELVQRRFGWAAIVAQLDAVYRRPLLAGPDAG